MSRRLSNVVGFDDAPFERTHRGDVGLVGVVFTRTRLDGVITGKVRRDGRNAAERMASMLLASPFHAHVRAVLLQGITVAGFNVVDVHELADRVGRPVLVVARRAPDLKVVRRTLQRAVPGWERKWKLIQQAGPMEPMHGVWVQRVGLGPKQATRLLEELTVHGKLPEPLRVAHLVAGGLGRGVSKGRA